MTARSAAHRRAFALVEAVQGEDPGAALRDIDHLGRTAGDWPEVLFVLAVARTIHSVVRPAPHEELHSLVQELHDTATDNAGRAVAAGLRALVAAGVGDTAEVLAGTSRAVALLDHAPESPQERCLAYVVAAAALNTLRLWELVDDLYSRALADPVAALAARQLEAIAVNRVLINVEHGLSLLEYGEREQSRAVLAAALDLVPFALAQDLRPLWRQDVEALADVVRVLLGEPPAVPLAEHRAVLASLDDVEVVPLLDATRALVEWRDQGRTDLAQQLAPMLSRSSGATTFPAWVRAEVLAAGDRSAAMLAQRAHAELMARQLWSARLAVLSAARAQQAAERRRFEHDLLTLAVHTDPLTGLQNRRRFDDWLQRPFGTDPTALLLLDLDDFKAVNDRFGHACGDDVLRRVGLTLRATSRPGDFAVRQGGDEFALVLRGPELSDEAVALRAIEVAERIAGEDWSRLAAGLQINVSIGTAITDDTGSATGPSLYRAADAALYRAKRRGPSAATGD